MTLGVSGYLPETASREEVLRAACAVADGQPFAGGPEGEACVARVIQHLRSGLEREEIGARLHINPDTVRTHRQRIMDKLGIHTRSGHVRNT